MPTPAPPVLTELFPAQPPAVAEPLCDVCRHTGASHDAIGLRFCAATLNGALTRGCICR
jgi:hypothetical protein